MTKCPKCGHELTEAEVFKLVQSVRGSRKSPKKAAASRGNLVAANAKREKKPD